MAISLTKRLLRRIPFVRWCAYRYAQQIRVKQNDAKWSYVQSVLVTVGNMTITWAGIERLLDELIAWYQHNCTDLSKPHPLSLQNKLKYLRVMQCDERFTDETREFLRKVRIEAKRLGNERHEIIHGMLWHRGGFSLEWKTQRVVYDGPNAGLTHRTFHNDDLRRLSREISNFSHYLAPKVWVLTGHYPGKFPVSEVEKALSEFGSR